MSTRPEDLMAGYLLGELFADERVRIESIMATGSVKSTAEAAALKAAHSVALYTISSKPSRRVFKNLLASLQGRKRLLPFRDRVTAFLGVDIDTAYTVLTTVDHRVGWTEGDSGVRTRTVLSGDSQLSATLVRANAGTVLPRPSSVTSAELLLLEGKLRDEDGHIATPGDRLSRRRGSRYRHEVQEGAEAVLLMLTREHASAD